MAASGRILDGKFAVGFLSALVKQDGAHFRNISTEHWRPVAMLDRPFGKVEGDLGVVIGPTTSGDKSNILLVVEREGSAPGNERSLLKWFEAARQVAQIILTRNSIKQVVTPSKIVLVAAFCATPEWYGSDFDKTVAFCKSLADIINDTKIQMGYPLTVEVQQMPSKVMDWNAAGYEFGRRAADYLTKVSNHL
jgi:hypothetical protein